MISTAQTFAQCNRLRAGGVLWPGRQVNLFLADPALGWFAYRLGEKRKPERGSITIERFAVRSARPKCISTQNCKNVILVVCRAPLRPVSINTCNGSPRRRSRGCDRKATSTMKHCCGFTSVQSLAPGPLVPSLSSIFRASMLRCQSAGCRHERLSTRTRFYSRRFVRQPVGKCSSKTRAWA
jgi:hypothetical protein